METAGLIPLLVDYLTRMYYPTSSQCFGTGIVNNKKNVSLVLKFTVPVQCNYK